MPEVIENINIREAQNGFVVTINGTTGSGDAKEWVSEDIVFLDKKSMKEGISKIIETL